MQNINPRVRRSWTCYLRSKQGDCSETTLRYRTPTSYERVLPGHLNRTRYHAGSVRDTSNTIVPKPSITLTTATKNRVRDWNSLSQDVVLRRLDSVVLEHGDRHLAFADCKRVTTLTKFATRKKTTPSVLAFAALLLTACVMPLWGQAVSSAQISGLVADPSGAAVPGAQVSVT